MKCPCCGSELSGAVPIDRLDELRFSDMEWKIVLRLRDQYPDGLFVDEVVKVLYPNGNNLKDDQNSMRVRLSRVRRKLERAGWTIPRRGSIGKHLLYRLEKLP